MELEGAYKAIEASLTDSCPTFSWIPPLLESVPPPEGNWFHCHSALTTGSFSWHPAKIWLPVTWTHYYVFCTLKDWEQILQLFCMTIVQIFEKCYHSISLLFSRLNMPTSFSLSSQGLVSSPLIILVAFFWICSILSASFLMCVPRTGHITQNDA